MIVPTPFDFAQDERVLENASERPHPDHTTPRRGCSGLAYSVDYVTTADPFDEAISTPGGTLYVDGGSLLYLIGSTMDWAEDDFAAGFTFANPNAKGACGCGESFTV